MVAPTPDRSFEFPADVPTPRLTTRAWRFSNVVWLAARIYLGYKGVQLWTRFVSARNKAELYRRQDLRAAAYLNQRFATAGDRRAQLVAEWLTGLRRRADVIDLYLTR